MHSQSHAPAALCARCRPEAHSWHVIVLIIAGGAPPQAAASVRLHDITAAQRSQACDPALCPSSVSTPPSGKSSTPLLLQRVRPPRPNLHFTCLAPTDTLKRHALLLRLPSPSPASFLALPRAEPALPASPWRTVSESPPHEGTPHRQLFWTFNFFFLCALGNVRAETCG